MASSFRFIWTDCYKSNSPWVFFICIICRRVCYYVFFRNGLYQPGGLEHLFFHSVGNVIIPTDFQSIIFQRGRRKTTNQILRKSSKVIPWSLGFGFPSWIFRGVVGRKSPTTRVAPQLLETLDGLDCQRINSVWHMKMNNFHEFRGMCIWNMDRNG